MGKKAFEEIAKIILVSLISVLISITMTRRVLLDSKLDKTEYYKDQELHKEQHAIERDELKYIRNRVDEIHDYLLQKKDDD